LPDIGKPLQLECERAQKRNHAADRGQPKDNQAFGYNICEDYSVGETPYGVLPTKRATFARFAAIQHMRAAIYCDNVGGLIEDLSSSRERSDQEINPLAFNTPPLDKSKRPTQPKFLVELNGVLGIVYDELRLPNSSRSTPRIRSDLCPIIFATILPTFDRL
jgi:hypothetical protein